MAIIYLVLFMAPQALLYLYLRERLPDPSNPARARLVRRVLAVLFTLGNLPWLVVGFRLVFGSVWGLGRIPFIGPFMAWQFLGWVYGMLVAVYVVGKAIVKGSRELGAVLSGVLRKSDPRRGVPLPAPRSVSRRRFLANATYAYAAVGAAVSAQGIWNAFREPVLTRRTLYFPDLPPGLDGLRLLHVSDVHAGIHVDGERMEAIVAQANALRPDLIVQTGDMIDISPRYVAPYVRAFRDLHAPLGVVTVIGNHDRYTGEDAVIAGVRDAGQVFVQNDVHVIEHRGATLALLGIDDPRSWTADDPQPYDIAAALRRAPPAAEAFRILLAHRPGAFDGAIPHDIPLTLAGHIHGGQLYVPVIGWSSGSMITKYVMGHFQRGNSQLYVSRGIGVVGIPIRVFVPPEIALLELRRS